MKRKLKDKIYFLNNGQITEAIITGITTTLKEEYQSAKKIAEVNDINIRLHIAFTENHSLLRSSINNKDCFDTVKDLIEFLKQNMQVLGNCKEDMLENPDMKKFKKILKDCGVD